MLYLPLFGLLQPVSAVQGIDEPGLPSASRRSVGHLEGGDLDGVPKILMCRDCQSDSGSRGDLASEGRMSDEDGECEKEGAASSHREGLLPQSVRAQRRRSPTAALGWVALGWVALGWVALGWVAASRVPVCLLRDAAVQSASIAALHRRYQLVRHLRHQRLMKNVVSEAGQYRHTGSSTTFSQCGSIVLRELRKHHRVFLSHQ